MADEHKDQPEADAGGEQPAESQETSVGREVVDETAVGHSVVDEGAGRETAVGHSVVDEGDAGAAAASEGATEVFFSREEPAAAAEPEPAPAAPVAPEPAPAAPAVPDAAPPQPAAAPPVGSGGTSPAAADRQAAESHDKFTEKPELFIAGAFVGAFVVGKLLKRLTGSDD